MLSYAQVVKNNISNVITTSNEPKLAHKEDIQPTLDKVKMNETKNQKKLYRKELLKEKKQAERYAEKYIDV